MQCPIHNQEFKLVPAGVSKKTGKPYNAFYACLTMGCTEKPPQGTPIPQAPAQEPRVSPDVWEKKERLSAAQTALNAASNIYQTTGEVGKTMVAAKQFYSFLRQAKQGIVQQEPAHREPQSEVGKKIAGAMSMPGSAPGLDNDGEAPSGVIDVEDLPPF